MGVGFGSQGAAAGAGGGHAAQAPQSVGALRKCVVDDVLWKPISRLLRCQRAKFELKGHAIYWNDIKETAETGLSASMKELKSAVDELRGPDESDDNEKSENGDAANEEECSQPSDKGESEDGDAPEGSADAQNPGGRRLRRKVARDAPVKEKPPAKGSSFEWNSSLEPVLFNIYRHQVKLLTAKNHLLGRQKKVQKELASWMVQIKNVCFKDLSTTAKELTDNLRKYEGEKRERDKKERQEEVERKKAEKELKRLAREERQKERMKEKIAALLKVPKADPVKTDDEVFAEICGTNAKGAAPSANEPLVKQKTVVKPSKVDVAPSPGQSKLIASGHPSPASAPNSQKSQLVKSESVKTPLKAVPKIVKTGKMKPSSVVNAAVPNVSAAPGAVPQKTVKTAAKLSKEEQPATENVLTSPGISKIPTTEIMSIPPKAASLHIEATQSQSKSAPSASPKPNPASSASVKTKPDSAASVKSKPASGASVQPKPASSTSLKPKPASAEFVKSNPSSVVPSKPKPASASQKPPMSPAAGLSQLKPKTSPSVKSVGPADGQLPPKIEKHSGVPDSAKSGGSSQTKNLFGSASKPPSNKPSKAGMDASGPMKTDTEKKPNEPKSTSKAVKASDSNPLSGPQPPPKVKKTKPAAANALRTSIDLTQDDDIPFNAEPPKAAAVPSKRKESSGVAKEQGSASKKSKPSESTG
mmetsp:Transcript_534/g.1316  ORF Transcript_534/g.1316 Transcript_534/m.1316 type:complete len:701 (+) Transcript_534:1-2103(+)